MACKKPLSGCRELKKGGGKKGNGDRGGRRIQTAGTERRSINVLGRDVLPQNGHGPYRGEGSPTSRCVPKWVEGGKEPQGKY